MIKPTSQMSPDELKKWQDQNKKNIRNYLFSINQPLVYYLEGIPVAEYKDGRIEKLRWIYIIAGPPGIGKSSSSFDYVPNGIPIIDQDLAAYQHRKDGFQDYQHLATLGVNQKIKDHLFQKKDFVLELNLGFQSHYDYLKSIAFFDSSNHIHLILYFTDSIKLCLLRAGVRHKNGGHLVEPSIIKEMYENTFPLFKENTTLFKTIKFLDVSDMNILEATSNYIPNWIKDNNLSQYLVS